MLRESKPTLTPRDALGPQENDDLSYFMQVSEENPSLASLFLEPYTTCTELSSDVVRLKNEVQPPEGRFITAFANLVDHEVDFLLEPDAQTKRAIELRIAGGEIPRLAKVKGFLGELVAHQQFLDRAALAAARLEADAQNQSEQDAALAIRQVGPDLDAA